MYAQVFLQLFLQVMPLASMRGPGAGYCGVEAGGRFGLFRNKTDAVVFCCMQAQLKGAEKDFMFDSK